MNDSIAVKKSLYIKYRPDDFESLVGQEHVKKILKAAAVEDKISHGYLLVGPRGTGKTTTARLIAKALNCTVKKDNGEMDFEKCPLCEEIQNGKFLDVLEIDAASNTGVDDMRDLIEKAKLTPTLGKKKVYIIDEVHMLSKSAFNALLKTLEEPPSHVHFVLATTEVNKIPPTIISRCQRFDFKRISIESIINRLQYICEQEKINTESNALRIIAMNSDGGLRDAISLLEQVIIDNKVTTENVEMSLGTVKEQLIDEFIGFLLEKKTNMALQMINKMYHDGVNLSQLKKESLEFLRRKILKALDSDASKEKVQRYLKLVQAINETYIENALVPQFPFELMICDITLTEDVAISSTVTEKQQQPTLEKPNQPEPPSVKSAPIKPIEKVQNNEEKKIIETNQSEYKFTSEELPDHKFTIKPTLDKIREDWNKIANRSSIPTLKFALREAFLENFEQDNLEISFRSEYHYKSVKNNKNIKEIEKLLHNYFNVNITVTITLSKIEVEKIEPEKILETSMSTPPITSDLPKEEEPDDLNIGKVEDLFNS